jgi:hypothetical protein
MHASPSLALWFRSLVRLAMVLPFLALSLLPQGFMPDRNAAGEMVLVLCTADGPVELTLDSGGHPVSKSKPAPCHWAGAGASVVLAQPLDLPLPGAGPMQTLAATEADLWRPAHDPRGIWARGPPSLI